MKTAAVIVAAGKGVRMGMAIGKQFLLLADRPILAHTLGVIDASPLIHRIVLVLAADDIHYCETKVLPELGLSKPIQIVAGGKQRQDSVYNGLREVQTTEDLVLIHDGVRPFISQQQIAATIEKANETGAAVLSIPVTDTLKRVDRNGRIEATLERKPLWMAQTPQVFRRAIIWQAHQAAQKDGYCGTDDAQLIERQGLPVAIVSGSRTNIKITMPEDLAMAEMILASRQNATGTH